MPAYVTGAVHRGQDAGGCRRRQVGKGALDRRQEQYARKQPKQSDGS